MESIASDSRPFSLSGTDTVHILLIGQDERDRNGPSRADAILLCTLRNGSNQLILTSFLRDLYVEIPGHDKNRLNAAYALGGSALLLETLHHNFGIYPDVSLEIDFSGFQEIVDTLGGVTLTLRQDEANAINKSTSGNLTEGTHRLNGQEALAYVRIRKLDSNGDFSRTLRQQKLLKAILQTCSQSSWRTLLALAKDMIPHAESDVSTTVLLRFALEALPLLPQLQIAGQQIPQAGTYTYETIQGMSVLTADLEAARKHLQESLPNHKP